MTEKAKNLGNQSVNLLPDNGSTYLSLGLTKRELFTAIAMGGLIARETDVSRFSNFHYSIIAEEAVKATDALLEELSKTE